MSMADVQRRKTEFLSQARQAAEAGRVNEAQEFLKKAEKADEALSTLKSVAALESAQAFRPTLPGTQQDELPAPDRAQAAYTLRFGNLDAAVKGILTDLHGANYEGQYWAQKAAFKSYLRKGEQYLSREEYGRLKEIVMTPDAVKAAVAQGVDNVGAIKATMVEAIDTLGGFVVPVDFQARVIERLQGMTVVRNRANVAQTSRDTVEIPTSTGGNDQYTSAVRVSWVDEKPTEGVAETNLTFGMETIPIHTVMAETWLGRNMVEDAAFDIESYLVGKFSESIQIDEDNRFLTGSGVGCPQGILPGGTNLLSLVEKVSGAAAALTWDGLIALSYAIPSQYRQNAVWIAERATYEAIAKLRDATSGQYLWNPYQYKGGADAAPPRLLGYPVLEQESMPSVSAGAYPIIFGDLSGYQIFDRIGMTVERYLDSSTARKNTVMYVVRRRLGAQPTELWRFAAQKVAAS